MYPPNTVTASSVQWRKLSAHWLNTVLSCWPPGTSASKMVHIHSRAGAMQNQLSRFYYQSPPNSLDLDCCFTISQGHRLTLRPIIIRSPQLVFCHVCNITATHSRLKMPSLGAAFHDCNHHSYLLCLRSDTVNVGYINRFRLQASSKTACFGTDW